ncbi:hypothetical protein MHBO_000438 [Bonamia ostreae]|uniref:Glycoside hydrolase family 19 catalytic domain-containing protein n=1 Tax=Bonamia ostreae TaxID=126728 RepID=A0ABV2AGF8_9EUKA
MWAELFPQQGVDNCNASNLLTHASFVRAVEQQWSRNSRFLKSNDMNKNRLELAAFLAQTSHETTGGWNTAIPPRFFWGYCFYREINPGYNYCDSTAFDECKANDYDCKCSPGKAYYGRGPIMLSWNYNYGLFSQEYFGDNRLLSTPELLESDGALAFEAAIWFWTRPVYSKPSCHDVIHGNVISSDFEGRTIGFGLLTNIINGGLECGKGNNEKENDRIGFYERYLEYFSVTDSRLKTCRDMKPF